MGEFKDAKLWMRVAFLMMVLGFTLDLFAFASDMPHNQGHRSSIEATLIIGLLAFLIGTVLVMCLVFFDECQDNKIILIIFIVCGFVAGIATVIGIAIWGDKEDSARRDIDAYAGTMGIMASFMGILAGIFGILALLGVGGK